MAEIEDEVDIPEGGLDLLGQLVMANYNNYAATTSRLVENLTEQNKRLVARLAYIETTVAELFNGQYMPTPAAVMRAVHPSEREISLWIEEDE